MPRPWPALACIALLGPTLVVPVGLWHVHGPAACAPAAADRNHHACGPSATSEPDGSAHAHDGPRLAAASASCITCALAAIVHVAEAVNPQHVFAAASAPGAAAAVVCAPRHVTTEPRTRGPPASRPA